MKIITIVLIMKNTSNAHPHKISKKQLNIIIKEFSYYYLGRVFLLLLLWWGVLCYKILVFFNNCYH